MKSSFFVSLLLLLVHDCADEAKPIILSQANGLPQRSVLPIRLDKATQTLGTRCSCYNSLAKNVYACATTKMTWSISSKVIGLDAKSRRNVVKMKAEMAAFSVSGSVEVLLPLWDYMISQTICLIFSSLRGLLFQDIKRKNINEIILIIMKKLL